MGKVMRALAWLLGAALVVGAVAVVLIVIAGRGGRLYESRLKAVFAVAEAQYAANEADATIRATYEGKTVEVSPDSYRILSYYMRQRAVKPYLPRALGGEKIHLDICGSDTADLYRLSDDSAIVVLQTGGDTMKVRIRDDGLWGNLVNAIE